MGLRIYRARQVAIDNPFFYSAIDEILPRGLPCSLPKTDRFFACCVRQVQQIGHSDGYRMRASRFSRVIFAIRTSTLALPKAPESWSLTSLREKLNKIGARVVSQGCYVTFQMAEVAVSRPMFAEIPVLIARLQARPRQREGAATNYDRRGAV